MDGEDELSDGGGDGTGSDIGSRGLGRPNKGKHTRDIIFLSSLFHFSLGTLCAKRRE